ncbi:O-antigen polymerase [Solibacillus isronensis]|uniref:O-antigen polymerase n=1 Tax=Solibacillus isronensis TaxID=412383 RepID=UPI0009A7F7B0|nr:O-antigen polymerase [Solibacillus isronensis]
MQILAALILSNIYIIGFLIGYLKKKDLLTPLCFFNLWMFLITVPRLITIDEIIYNGQPVTDSGIFLYLVFTIIAVLTINVSMIIFNNINSGQIISRKDSNNGNNASGQSYKKTIAILLFSVGALSKLYLINVNGGLAYIWSNLDKRSFMLSGSSYIDSLEILMVIGISLMLDCYFESNKRKYLIMTISMFLIGAVLLIAFGARAPLLEAIITLLFIINYRSNKISLSTILKPKIFGVILLCVLFIVMMPMLRFEDNKNLYSNPIEWIKSAAEDVDAIFEEISSVDKDVFTYSYFIESEKWLGSNYIDLLYTPIPRTLFPAKPPSDDGVYLANLMHGYDVEPSIPYKLIPYQSSVPFSSSGIMYANFGVIGLIIGSILLGYIYQKIYINMVKHNYSIYRIILYQFIIFKFGFSNQEILGSIIPIVIILTVEKVFYRRIKI